MLRHTVTNCETSYVSRHGWEYLKNQINYSVLCLWFSYTFIFRLILDLAMVFTIRLLYHLLLRSVSFLVPW